MTKKNRHRVATVAFFIFSMALPLPAEASPSTTGGSNCQEEAHKIFKQAEKLFKDQEMEKALSIASEGLKLDPKSDEIRNLRAEIYISRDQPRLALAELNTALSINPKNKHALQNRGLTYMYFKEYKKAIADFSAKIGKAPAGTVRHPKYAAVWLWRGEAYEKTGDYKSALADFTQVTQIPRQSFSGYKRRAALLTKMGKTKEALADWSKMIELSPDDENSFKNRGDLHAALGDVKSALRDYNQAISLEPGFADAYSARALVWKKLGQSAKAESDLKMVARLKQPNKI